eukprot:CAMPEP_0206023734 /NCGR_PEP_ID=MMETSP1464-20131121/36966_1 /ASSEMBLY_ACC=CAM_ASM_001124 /TAXON_ID=119497 /ORGANISM="Exanthemachrysis gayraliae, Strain RCC1523" /LENGTH=39 /DNA_ID= /DNA_START= /DNA_END= /DNA_ORIENTATION=
MDPSTPLPVLCAEPPWRRMDTASMFSAQTPRMKARFSSS